MKPTGIGGTPEREAARRAKISAGLLARGWCKPGCTCGRHGCTPDCSCGRHSEETRAKIIAANARRVRRPLRERFWEKVVVGAPDECWVWTAGRKSDGRGQFRLATRNQTSSRIAWILTNGEIPAGLQVLHHCDNPPCCNPAHLFLGTHQDNIDDMMSKGRHWAQKARAAA